ncbi:MAG: FAD:protein FMN transferase [Clostridia bacterium]|nr:FAD:protein FMN transferase [Clostridia bacterium]
MKSKILLSVMLCFTLLAAACSTQKATGYGKYSYEFLGTFDTVIQFVGYAKSQQDFEAMAKAGQARFAELDKLYDIYNDYQGINNVKTINNNAGKKPVEVKQEIIDLIAFSIDWYQKTNGKCNIALGAMLSIWHDYREAGINNPEQAKLPPMADLQNAMKYTDISKVIIDKSKKTIYLEDPHMQLDVGAVAKGYATEVVTKELLAKGYNNFIISSGGNVRTTGKPLDGVRKNWGIGIQNPNGNTQDPNDAPLDIVFLSDASVVTSGDYQRYYTVNGKRYHHLIDPTTLMPATYYRAVTIVTPDSGFADFMSTTLFLTPYEESRKLAEKLGIDAIWIMADGTMKTTEHVKTMMKNLGGAKNE